MESPVNAINEDTVPVFDWALAISLAGGRIDLAKSILTMFMNELPQTLTAINTAYAAKEYRALEDQLHKLLGACSYCGLPRLKSTTAQYEMALKKDQRLSYKGLHAKFNLEVSAALKAYKLNENNIQN